MTRSKVEYEPAAESDLDELVQLRIAAMRESLEKIGRFDATRARERFALGFEPARTRFIVVSGARVGFVVVKERDDGLWLDHLYLHPRAQGSGVGSEALEEVLREADRRGLALRVGALRGSASNRFYLRHGFLLESESEWDLYYRRQPRSGDDQ